MKEQMKEYVSLKNKNTYRIDTSTRYYYEPENKEDLQEFLKYAKTKQLDYFLLGNGSNVILSDTMYPGVVVKLNTSEFQKIEYNGSEVWAGSGVMMPKLAQNIIEHGLKGLEWASGIPGTVGGSVFGNAGAYNEATFDHLLSVTYLDAEGKVQTKTKENLTYGYRTSYFKEHPENIILGATFLFEKGTKEESKKLIESRLERRLQSQPLNYPSAGSVFRNPSPELPSWKLIDEVGLKGYRIGDAMVSEKHANFIINVGVATGKDIESLIQLIKDKVKKEKNVELVLEQEIKRW